MKRGVFERPLFALLVATEYLALAKALFNDQGYGSILGEDKGGMEHIRKFSRATQVVQLSHYGAEMCLKVLCQQDRGSYLSGWHGHSLSALYGDLNEKTRDHVRSEFRRWRDKDHELFPHHDYGEVEDVFRVSDGAYNNVRYHMFERSGLSFSYSINTIEVGYMVAATVWTRWGDSKQVKVEEMVSHGYSTEDIIKFLSMSIIDKDHFTV